MRVVLTDVANNPYPRSLCEIYLHFCLNHFTPSLRIYANRPYGVKFSLYYSANPQNRNQFFNNGLFSLLLKGH